VSGNIRALMPALGAHATLHWPELSELPLVKHERVLARKLPRHEGDSKWRESATSSGPGSDMLPSLLQLRFLNRVAPLRGAESIVGRSIYCSIIIDHPSVSRVHVIVSRQNGQTLVRDVGSKNGTRLNGDPVGSQPIALGEGDLLQIGEVKCRVEACDRKEPIATTERPSALSEDTTQTFVGNLRKKLEAKGR